MSRTAKYIDKQMRDRFAVLVNDYATARGMTLKDVAESWGVNYTHLHNVLQGRKALSVTILTQCHVHGELDLNYIIGGTLRLRHGNKSYER